MNSSLGFLLLAALFGFCCAGNGYNYIRPAKELGSSGPVLQADGSTKSVYVFGDPDEHQSHSSRTSQQRPISYRQPAASRTTYSKVAPQQRRVVYSQPAPQRSVVYSQRAPQQNTVTYNQIVPQPKPITFTQQPKPIISYTQQQRPLTYSTIVPQQQISYNTNRVVPQQPLPFLTNQFVPQQNAISYNQQQPFVYNQIVPQQLPISTYQVAPQQQFQFAPYPVVQPVRQNLQVIFVKTPGYEAYTEVLLKMAKEAIQSQTIVYVLSKEPDVAELTRRFQEIQATARKMPEVRFIKYKTDEEAIEAQKAIQAEYDALPGTSNTYGTPIGSGSGTGIKAETGSINSAISSGSTSGILPSLTTTKTTGTSSEDEFYSQNSPPFVPTGIDVVPGSSYLPPHNTRK
ncbi:uncharacterized protein LOC129938846 [Eupeodes corollae]|uniref:uncharacterized protein LOC129938846 n=1 Tax=Eupeodes corollae TaxID=290404 RepID=UPI00249094F1|nr:uncharacterized protein LOC129938846 [Eupeodes corollae]